MRAATSNVVSHHQNAVALPGAEPARWPVSGAVVQERSGAIPARLTPRQLEVLALLCEGLPNKVIARRLDIATGTVKIHVGCILRELGASSRLQAVVSAQRSGLLS